MRSTRSELIDYRWSGLLKSAGIAGVASVAIALIEAIIVALTGHFATPYDAADWFKIFQQSRIIGLFAGGIMDIVVVALLAPMFFALYIYLKNDHQTIAIIAVLFAFLGIAVYLPTNDIMYLLHSSDLYSLASTDAQKLVFLEQGQSVVAAGRYGMVWSTGFLFIATAQLLISLASFNDRSLNRISCLIGILSGLFIIANAISLFFIPVDLGWTSTLLASIGGLLSFAWWVLIGIKLYGLGRRIGSANSSA